MIEVNTLENTLKGCLSKLESLCNYTKQNNDQFPKLSFSTRENDDLIINLETAKNAERFVDEDFLNLAKQMCRIFNFSYKDKKGKTKYVSPELCHTLNTDLGNDFYFLLTFQIKIPREHKEKFLEILKAKKFDQKLPIRKLTQGWSSNIFIKNALPYQPSAQNHRTAQLQVLADKKLHQKIQSMEKNKTFSPEKFTISAGIVLDGYKISPQETKKKQETENSAQKNSDNNKPKTAILVCHGNMMLARELLNDDTMQEMANRANADVYVFDYPGYGLSTGECRTAKALQNSVYEMAKKIISTEVKHLILDATSIGGVAAIKVTRQLQEEMRKINLNKPESEKIRIELNANITLSSMYNTVVDIGVQFMNKNVSNIMLDEFKKSERINTLKNNINKLPKASKNCLNKLLNSCLAKDHIGKKWTVRARLDIFCLLEKIASNDTNENENENEKFNWSDLPKYVELVYQKEYSNNPNNFIKVLTLFLEKYEYHNETEDNNICNPLTDDWPNNIPYPDKSKETDQLIIDIIATRINKEKNYWFNKNKILTRCLKHSGSAWDTLSWPRRLALNIAKPFVAFGLFVHGFWVNNQKEIERLDKGSYNIISSSEDLVMGDAGLGMSNQKNAQAELAKINKKQQKLAQQIKKQVDKQIFSSNGNDWMMKLNTDNANLLNEYEIKKPKTFQQFSGTNDIISYADFNYFAAIIDGSIWTDENIANTHNSAKILRILNLKSEVFKTKSYLDPSAENLHNAEDKYTKMFAVFPISSPQQNNPKENQNVDQKKDVSNTLLFTADDKQQVFYEEERIKASRLRAENQDIKRKLGCYGVFRNSKPKAPNKYRNLEQKKLAFRYNLNKLERHEIEADLLDNILKKNTNTDLQNQRASMTTDRIKK